MVLRLERVKNRDIKLDVKGMKNYRKSARCTYDIKYHLVGITKYRKPVITGKEMIRTRELIRIICQSNEVEILEKLYQRFDKGKNGKSVESRLPIIKK